ncbi:MAG: hypothetical protein ACKPKO_50925, partial [Candidatus Fonsibacter sp.]
RQGDVRLIQRGIAASMSTTTGQRWSDGSMPFRCNRVRVKRNRLLTLDDALAMQAFFPAELD